MDCLRKQKLIHQLQCHPNQIINDDKQSFLSHKWKFVGISASVHKKKHQNRCINGPAVWYFLFHSWIEIQQISNRLFDRLIVWSVSLVYLDQWFEWSLSWIISIFIFNHLLNWRWVRKEILLRRCIFFSNVVNPSFSSRLKFRWEKSNLVIRLRKTNSS